ncbi:hypothetical protein RND81_08G152000 [Saponaria officinalis]|uniref:Nodulin-like domain-containing protein n=1 Tax=Saponaria officinalis TaxID=3572 RepID=A0AAW1JB27_SAPOF
MDDTGGGNVDTGIHGDELRLWGVLGGDEGRDGVVAGGIELLGDGVGYGEDVGVVVGGGVDVAAGVGGCGGCRSNGVCWVWTSMVYSLWFLLSTLLYGCSICWFNTVCFVLCVKNFPSNRALAISLTVSFNGVSAALYALTANAVNSSSSSVYLLLNAVIPLLTSLLTLIPILQQPKLDPLPPDNAVQRDSTVFLLLNVVAALTGFYLLFLTSATKSVTSSRLLLVGALLLLIFPLFVPGIVYAKEQFILVDDDDLEFHKEATRKGGSSASTSTKVDAGKGQLVTLGEEHSAAVLVRRVDFWLYYAAYFCGGTIGLVYSNNLGQIAQSLGQSSNTATLLTLYSSFSFFGRLLSAIPDYARAKFNFARTGWLALALTPTPVTFFILTGSDSTLALKTGTALIGLSSGFIFAAAVSITSDLFGPSSVGVNHNILITNIPIGSLVYGLLAAVVYDVNSDTTRKISMVTDTLICMGRQCYYWTFVSWGCLSVVGFVTSVLLFLRTRHAYERFERHRLSSQFD